MNWTAYHIFEIDKLVLINTHSPLLADSLRGRENRRLVSLDNRTGEMRTNAVGIWKKTEVLSWYWLLIKYQSGFPSPLQYKFVSKNPSRSFSTQNDYEKSS